MKNKIATTLALVLGFLQWQLAHALGPLDGEAGVAFWSNHFEADISNGDLDVGTTLAHGEVWLFNEWGVRGAYYDSDLEESEFSNQNRTQLEVRKRFLSLGDNNFLAFGAGLENIALKSGQESDGLRFSAEARLGLPSTVFLYGKAAWSPALQSTSEFDDISSREMEVGAHFTPAPFVSLRLGYLQYELDYRSVASGGGGGTTSSGFFIGAGVHW
ncbi:MAG: hypothetical protein GKR95_16950 [Gammaproteobacteria bacterium]|nr:hypothetical protein [Gammaproteobacteria bacterium]